MEFKVRKASDIDFEETVNINSFEELKQIKEKCKTNKDYWKCNELIINFDYNVITICNYYIE